MALRSSKGYEHDAAFDVSSLAVDEIHTLHYEQYGNHNGLPVIFLHGGPGGQIGKVNTVYFDTNLYRVVLFDQRGAGRSTPRNELRNNTTHHLIQDIERLREKLQIEQWHMVFGGSWGSALGLLYAQTFPKRLKCLVIRGVATIRKTEMRYSRRGPDGAAKIYPEMYEQFINFLPVEARADPIAGYYKLLTSEDEDLRKQAAIEWNRWDLTMTNLVREPDLYAKLDDLEWCFTHALLETHYFHHAAWLEEGQLLANMDRIKNIRGAIVQGRYDLFTPPATAWEIHKAWTKSSIHFVEAAGHSAMEPDIMSKLTEVCDEFAKLN